MADFKSSPTSVNQEQLREFARSVTRNTPYPDLFDVLPFAANNSLLTLLRGHFQTIKPPLSLPKLDAYENQVVSVFSDFSGDAPNDGDYRTYAFLFCAKDSIAAFNQQWQPIRESSQLKTKEISYKKLGYADTIHLLPQLLAMSDNFLVGYLQIVAVHKDIKTFFGIDPKLGEHGATEAIKTLGIECWKPKVAEEALRISSLLAGCYAILVEHSLDLFWHCDRDQTSANPQQFENLAKLLQHMLNQTADARPTSISYSHPFEPKAFEFLDILSLTDLVAGVTNEVISKKYEDGAGKLLVKNGSHHLSHWLSRQGLGLRKSILKIVPQGSESLIGSRVEVHAPESHAGLEIMKFSF